MSTERPGWEKILPLRELRRLSDDELIQLTAGLFGQTVAIAVMILIHVVLAWLAQPV